MGTMKARREAICAHQITTKRYSLATKAKICHEIQEFTKYMEKAGSWNINMANEDQKNPSMDHLIKF